MIRSDTDAGLTPMSPLCVVSISAVSLLSSLFLHPLPSAALVAAPKESLEGSLEEEGEYVPDGVTSPQSNPLWNGSVLLLGSRKLLLGAE